MDRRRELPGRKSQVGLDQHQVRRWDSWHRFTILALAALAVLAICAADTAAHETAAPTDSSLIRLTVNEIHRLINTSIIRPNSDLTHRYHWSQWRRHHHARARRSHYTRRSTSNDNSDHERRLPY
ncbi:hypothetical protein AB0B97_00335 [Micromonospora sp. NPDC049004]|uniref:hypothetical protein n=1 Tax=Micromonospora sp. NPDC049004 TaxID=3154348 RepID=UPI00340DD569